MAVKMKPDIEIAQQCDIIDITEIAAELGLPPDEIELYGKYKAKIPLETIERFKDRADGKLVLVTAINPTPAGEGKTTTTVGLGQAMKHIGKNAIIALREPSLGPVMGIKGGAAGGGYSQVIPMEDINLHFTGDMHAITAANNLLSAAIDNHIHQGNCLKIDARQIVFKRVMDMNDRALRQVTVGLGGKINGFPREDGFLITVASEVMAILCLASDLQNLKLRLGDILIGYSTEGSAVYARDLKVAGAMALLLKDAIKPNLVQTLEGTPCLMHGGPFANIAHGCNSLIATKLALKMADITITEAGFGADLGAEKFFDIKCRTGGLKPDAVVLVATIRALKYNGCVAKKDLTIANVDALQNGICNLDAHIRNLQKYNVPVVVAINLFHTDSENEINFIHEYCMKKGVRVAFSNVFAEGGKGGVDLANTVVSVLENANRENDEAAQGESGSGRLPGFAPLYDVNLPIKDKIHKIAAEIYGAKSVNYSPAAEKSIKLIESLSQANLPVCIAKTQYSFSDNAALLGRPTGFELNVKDISLSAGAGFIVVLTGEVMTMPGLPKTPSAEKIDIDRNGTITGLF